jgi:predicted  nucleic acid-binding Zn-ribbon protein
MTTDARISKLEAQIDRLEAKEAELRSQLAQAQLDQWYGRIEDLELQAHLGAMDTQDRIRALVAQAREVWQDAKRQVEGTASSASDVAGEVRSRLEGILRDLRRGMVDARPKAT